MEKPNPPHPFPAAQPSEKLVYLATEDFPFALHLSQQLIHFGYPVQHVHNVKSLVNINEGQNFTAAIIDIPSWTVLAADLDIFSEIQALKLSNGKLLFTSEQDNQSVRLNCIRAGGVAFFTKPVNVVSLVDKLDTLNRSTATPQPSKVLIVEDQHSVASYYQLVLKMSGLDAQIATNPANVLDQMRELHPDLILMNTYLPDINASDLARVIRQIDDFVSIPIIFLSSEADFGKRIEALDLGGDDFLVKPIKSAQLIAVVRSRIERAKTLRSFMVRDSLTGLLNHTAFRSNLRLEVERCKRHKAAMALAMLDIDHFKTVNDTYGHAAGDSALKGLSRLLRQRLRKCDIVGRYGGDEFVALLLECTAEHAMMIMDEIRLHFSEIEFFPNETRSLSLTFSCGISTFPSFQSAESMSDSADQALYTAKAGQRNRVIIAQP